MQRIRKISLCLLIAAADCDHYDFYAGEIFEQAVADQCTFLVQHPFG
jgi:hypothetical protein